MPLAPALEYAFNAYELRVNTIKEDWSARTSLELNDVINKASVVVQSLIFKATYENHPQNKTLQDHVCDFLNQNPPLALYWLRLLRLRVSYYSCGINEEHHFFAALLNHMPLCSQLSSAQNDLLTECLIKDKKVHTLLFKLAIQMAIQYFDIKSIQRIVVFIFQKNLFPSYKDEGLYPLLLNQIPLFISKQPYTHYEITLSNQDRLMLDCFKFMLNEFASFDTMEQIPEGILEWIEEGRYTPLQADTFQLALSSIFQAVIQKPIVDTEIFLYGLIQMIRGFEGMKQESLLLAPDIPADTSRKIVTALANGLSDMGMIEKELGLILNSDLYAAIDQNLESLMTACIKQKKQRLCITLWNDYKFGPIQDYDVTFRFLEDLESHAQMYASENAIDKQPWHFIFNVQEENNSVLEMLTILMKIIDARITYQYQRDDFYDECLNRNFARFAAYCNAYLPSAYQSLLVAQIDASFACLGPSYQFNSRGAAKLKIDLDILITTFDLGQQIINHPKLLEIYQTLSLAQQTNDQQPMVATLALFTPQRQMGRTLSISLENLGNASTISSTEAIEQIEEADHPSCFSFMNRLFSCN